MPRDRIRYVGDWCDRAALGGLDLEGLRITSQGNDFPSNGQRELYAWEVEYCEVYRVSARRIRQMCQTLVAIERRMDKLEERYGRPASFGAFGHWADSRGAANQPQRDRGLKAASGRVLPVPFECPVDPRQHEPG